MPSFDVVSKTDLVLISLIAPLMALSTSARYDFKNSQSKVTRESDEVELIGDDQYKIEQVQQI